MEPEEILEIILSILLASAVAYALGIIATCLGEAKAVEWGISSLLLMGSTIAIIQRIFDSPIRSPVGWAKVLFIMVFSLFTLAFARYLQFSTSISETTNVPSYLSATILLMASGGSLIYLSHEIRKTQRTREKDNLWVWGLIVIIIAVAIFLAGFLHYIQIRGLP